MSIVYNNNVNKKYMPENEKHKEYKDSNPGLCPSCKEQVNIWIPLFFEGRVSITGDSCDVEAKAFDINAHRYRRSTQIFACPHCKMLKIGR